MNCLILDGFIDKLKENDKLNESIFMRREFGLKNNDPSTMLTCHSTLTLETKEVIKNSKLN